MRKILAIFLLIPFISQALISGSYISGGPTFIDDNTNDTRRITLLSIEENTLLENINERWEKQTFANGDIVMIDHVNKIMWPYDVSISGVLNNWYLAMDFATNLTLAGFSDWELPNFDELQTINDGTQVQFFGNLPNYPEDNRALAYWVESGYPFIDADHPTLAGYYHIVGYNQGLKITSVASKDGTGLSSNPTAKLYSWPMRYLDSDADGLSDADEVNTYGTDPNNADTEADGLSDGDEVNTYGTDPNDADTDGDGLSDKIEIDNGLSPNSVNIDPDGDGLSVTQEILLGTDPLNVDTDGDGLSDSQEVSITSSYEIVIGQYTWYDARDGAITNGGHLVTINSEAEWNIVNQLISESGINKFWLGASDADVEGAWEWVTGEPWDFTFWAEGEPNNDIMPYKPDGENYLSTWGGEGRWNDSDNGSSDDSGYIIEAESTNILSDPNDQDSDDDGLSDGDEVNIHNTDPNNMDSDIDGLSDGDEVNTYGTDPNDADSDDDGLSDGDEVNTYGTDPNDADSDDDGLSDYLEIIEVIQTNSTFSVIEGEYTWHEAKNDAELRGGRLAVLSSYVIEQNAKAVINSFDGSMWIGLSDEAEEGVFRWINNELMTYYNNIDYGLSSVDNGSSSEDYVHINWISRGPNRSWNDAYPDDRNVGRNDYTPADFNTYGKGYLLEIISVLQLETPTDPNDPDSDDDGLTDGDEVSLHGTDPNNNDSDADGLSDTDEVNIYGTDPNDADSDADGLIDGDEIINGTDPLINIKDGLVGHYTFEGSASDISGNDNHATLYNIDYTESYISTGQAIEFNGNSSWGKINHSSSLTVDGEYSLSYWSKHDPAQLVNGYYSWLISKGDDGSNNEVYRQQFTGASDNSAFLEHIWNTGISGGSESYGEVIVENNNAWEWHCVSVTHVSGFAPKIYINGVEIGATSSNQTSHLLNETGANIIFGCNQRYSLNHGSNLNERYHKGLLDNLRIYNKALNPQEVAEIYTLESPPYTPTNEYHLIEHELTWDQCLAYARYYGGELAAITSYGEEAYVTSWLDSQIGEQDSEVFLGGSDADVEDTWTWSSGETWDYENWYIGEPNNQNGDEDYLELTHNSVINWDWKWNDFDGSGADATYYMLIEAADTSSMPTGVVITAATDSDGDGLADIAEIQTYGTDPNDSDSDDDGLSDGDEVANGTDPTVAEPANEDYELTLYFRNISAGFFNQAISLNDSIGAGCRVELLWSSTNAANTAFGDHTDLMSTVTGAGVADSYGFGYWSSSSLSTEDLPEESGYVWARVYNQAATYYIDLGEVDVLSALDGLDEDTVLKVPDSTKEKRFYIMDAEGTAAPFVDRDGDGLSDEYEEDNGLDPNDADSDDDGISDGDEVLTYKSNPLSNDTDDDGLEDGLEVSNSVFGLDINVNSSNVVNFIKDINQRKPELGGGGLTLEQAKSMMRDLRPGSQTIDVSNGTARIRMRLEESSDLMTNWSSRAEMMEVDIPATNNVQFFRFRIED